MLNQQISHRLNVVLEAVRVIENNFSDRVKEKVLLLGFRLCHQSEHLVQEELRVSNCDLTKRDRSSLSDLFVSVGEVLLNQVEDIGFLRQVNELTVLAEAKQAGDLLLGCGVICKGREGGLAAGVLRITDHHDGEAESRLLRLKRYQVLKSGNRNFVHNLLLGRSSEKFLKLVEARALDQLRSRGGDSHLDHIDVVLSNGSRVDQVSSDSQSQGGSLQILLRDHGCDLGLNLINRASELRRVSPSECLQALKCVQLQLALRLIQ